MVRFRMPEGLTARHPNVFFAVHNPFRGTALPFRISSSLHSSRQP